MDNKEAKELVNEMFESDIYKNNGCIYETANIFDGTNKETLYNMALTILENKGAV